MTLQEIKDKFLEIIYKQNNLKGRVLDDLSETTEAYVEIFGKYPECIFIPGNPDRDKIIENIRAKYECFFPGAYEVYKEDDDKKIVFDKLVYDSNIIAEPGFVSIDNGGVTIYTNDNAFKEDIINSYVGVVQNNPCEVYWVSNGQNGFGASKLSLKDGKFNVKSHYNDDFDYDKVNNFINSEDSGLVILHGTAGTGKEICRVIEESIILLLDKNGEDLQVNTVVNLRIIS